MTDIEVEMLRWDVWQKDCSKDFDIPLLVRADCCLWLSKWHHLCEQGMCKSTRGRRISPSRATIEASGMAAKILCPVSTTLCFLSPEFFYIAGSSPPYPSETGNSCQLTESKSCRRTFTLYGVCNRFKHRLNYSEAKSRTLQTAIRV